MGDDKLLHIYLSDHLAGARVGQELAKRCLSNNEGNALGALLRDRLVPEINEDKATLERVIDAVDGSRAPWKQAAAWMAEKAGRLKLNGQLTGYSALSRLLEVEGLALGVEGKVSMWRSLAHLADARMRNLDFDRLIVRGTEQRGALESHRIEASRALLG